MKRIPVYILIFVINSIIFVSFGQQSKTQSKKGGFAVGGYDNSRTQKDKTVTKRSVIITEEAESADKAVKEEADVPPSPPAAEMAAPAPAQSAPASAPVAAPVPQNDDKAEAVSPDTREKVKPVKKSKNKQRR